MVVYYQLMPKTFHLYDPYQKMREKKILKYEEEDMLNALEAVKNGMPVRTAARTFRVPRTTLLYKHTGKYPVSRKMGPKTFLTEEEEQHLVRWIFHVSSVGFPVTRTQLLDSVQMLLKDIKRTTPFTNDRPGRRWFESFLKRHPQISERVSQNLTENRASVTEQKLKDWFNEVQSYLKNNSYDDILEDPRRIFNLDETAFFLSPKGEKVLVRRGQKVIYNFINNDEKECLTVLFGGNAAGMQPPPMIVFSYERIPQAITNRMPPKWGIGKTENGWMTSESFFEYVANVFYPWIQENDIPRPVILFVDGHTSHLTLNLSRFCSENGIILIALYPNSTHICQPMDVGIFRPLKNGWKKTVRAWRFENGGRKLKRENFGPLLKKTIDEVVTPEMFVNSFRTCGLYPFSSNGINYENKLLKGRKIDNVNEERKLDGTLKTLETMIGEEKLLEFRSCKGKWHGNIQDTSLFELWKAQQEIDNIQVFDTKGDGLEEENNLENLSTSVDSGHLNDLLDEYNGSLVLELDTDFLLDNDGNKIQNLNLCSEELNLENSEDKRNEKLDDGSTNDIEISQHTSDTETVNNYKDSDKTPEKSKIIIHENILLKTNVSDEADTSKNFQIDVPSPFKRNLFWPDATSTPANKKRKKEKIPSVATSDQWKEYHMKKEVERKKKEQEKEDRKRKRIEKQKLITKKKLKSKNIKVKVDLERENNVENDEEEEEVEENITKSIQKVETNRIKTGCYVIVRYNEEFFPGVVREAKEKFFVSAMTRSKYDSWKWPQKEDVLWYDADDIVEIIKEPTPLNNRGVFCVPEIKNY